MLSLLGAHLAVGQDVRFEKTVLLTDFVSEGIAAADVNGDGRLDLVADAYWFEAPDWTPHTYRPAQTYAPMEGYSDTFLQYAQDVDLDGDPDVIRIGSPGQEVVWYEHPGRPDRPWPEHRIADAVGNEAPQLVDVDGDGRGDLLFGDEASGTMGWYRAARTPDEPAWTRFALSGPDSLGTHRYAHGLGLGDVNGDGRSDVLIREGWWEAPAAPTQTPWRFHAVDFAGPCAQMFAYDVDGDGDQDVLASSAHDYGLWWNEQHADGTWTRHLIHREISQTHSLALVDVDGDGLRDLVTGKRPFPHLGKDPGAFDPPVLAWFELQHTPTGPTWTPHIIDDASGIGLSFVAQDLTGDGRLDLAVANKSGVFVFEQE